jgi:hypothetical protein
MHFNSQVVNLYDHMDWNKIMIDSVSYWPLLNEKDLKEKITAHLLGAATGEPRNKHSLSQANLEMRLEILDRVQAFVEDSKSGAKISFEV